MVRVAREDDKGFIGALGWQQGHQRISIIQCKIVTPDTLCIGTAPLVPGMYNINSLSTSLTYTPESKQNGELQGYSQLSVRN